MRWPRLLGLLALAPLVAIAAPAREASLDVDIAAYRRAAAGRLGALTGRAYETGAKSTAADRPLPGTVVTLLPRSETFLRTLDEIKRGARASITAYRDAAAAVRRAREAYERVLWAEGALDLVRSTDVAADGAFAVRDLPSGQWVLIGVRSLFVDKPARRPTPRESQTYATPPRVIGHGTVHVWLLEVQVTGGRTEAVELTDRNAWLTGIVEEREPDANR